MSITINKLTHEITLQTPRTVSMTLSPTGVQGPKGDAGVGVTSNSLTLGNYILQYNDVLDTFDITYSEV